GKKAAYLNTGVWAKKAIKEAKGFGEVVEVASSAESTYTYIPKYYTIPVDADYFHITTINTIYGTEIKKELDSPVPMIADMSSDILSRPVDVPKYICILLFTNSLFSSFQTYHFIFYILLIKIVKNILINIFLS
ncbi:hypothetical protein EZS27_029986, partial [termite gut metagenome]